MMVWGPPGPEREARKAKKEPLLKKEITSELGNISPVIVVPGPYSDAELAFQGESITAAIANNASFNCNSAKLLVAPKGWDKARQAQAGDRRRARQGAGAQGLLSRAPSERWNELVAVAPQGQAHRRRDAGDAAVGHHRGHRSGGRPTRCSRWSRGARCCQRDGHRHRPIRSRSSTRRSKFCNDKVWGTLSATIIVHPSTMKDPKFAEALDRAVAGAALRHGVPSTTGRRSGSPSAPRRGADIRRRRWRTSSRARAGCTTRTCSRTSRSA